MESTIQSTTPGMSKWNKLLAEYPLAANSINRLTGGKFCYWDKEKNNIQLNDSMYKLGLLFGVTFVVPGMYHLYTLFQKPENSSNQDKINGSIQNDMKYVGMIAMGGCLSVISFSQAFIVSPDIFPDFYNKLAHLESYVSTNFNESVNSGQGVLQRGRVACMLWLLRLGGLRTTGAVMTIIAVILPQIPINIFSYFPGALALDMIAAVIKIFNAPETIFQLVTLPLVFGVNLVMWTTYIKISFLSIIEKIIGSTALTVLLHQFSCKMYKLTIFLPRNPGKKIPQTYLNKLTSFYREIQILTSMFNEFESNQLVYLLLSFGISQVFAVLGIVKGGLSTNIFILMFYNSALFNLIISIVFLFGCCAQVHDTSKHLLNELKRNVGNGQKNSKQILRTFQIVKVKFGSTNYIEKITPVIFQMFLVLRMVDALLLTSKNAK